ncbi:hypothetical protein IFM89_005322 [Coptis chinensis]|uniref:Uncharacterized protein n=1 Tax=Coptis chinensis TaxID=261450 RepID=A0A835HAP8_9MAGN|nr:hypothetical protein IFM89_005322 [Coptis chinensis]
MGHILSGDISTPFVKSGDQPCLLFYQFPAVAAGARARVKENLLSFWSHYFRFTVELDQQGQMFKYASSALSAGVRFLFLDAPKGVAFRGTGRKKSGITFRSEKRSMAIGDSGRPFSGAAKLTNPECLLKGCPNVIEVPAGLRKKEDRIYLPFVYRDLESSKPFFSLGSFGRNGNVVLIITHTQVVVKAERNLANRGGRTGREEEAGSINISNILTGKCLAKIRASSSDPQMCCTRTRNTVSEALEDITALFYDEERNEIYTGNRQGLVHVWSN